MIVDNKNNINKTQLPWQFSTAGIILGFFLSGYLAISISLIGNHLHKTGRETKELKLAYNIIIAIPVILLALYFLFILFILMIAILTSF